MGSGLQFRIESVPQPVANDVDVEKCRHYGEAGNGCRPPGDGEVVDGFYALDGPAHVVQMAQVAGVKEGADLRPTAMRRVNRLAPTRPVPPVTRILAAGPF